MKLFFHFTFDHVRIMFVTDSDVSERSVQPQRRQRRRQRQLCQFLWNILKDKTCNPSIIEWVQEEESVFRFVQPRIVAKLWGDRRRRQNMTYEHLSRAMRYFF